MKKQRTLEQQENRSESIEGWIGLICLVVFFTVMIVSLSIGGHEVPLNLH